MDFFNDKATQEKFTIKRYSTYKVELTSWKKEVKISEVGLESKVVKDYTIQ